jgi:hypothetical protein
MEPLLLAPAPLLEDTFEESAAGDPHLRSFREVSSYRVEENGNSVGFVQDMNLDDHIWRVISLVVMLGDWIPRNPVEVDRNAVRKISWASRRVELVDGALKGNAGAKASGE